MGVLWGILIVFAALLWIVTAWDIIRQRHHMGVAKMSAWILLALIFPFVGPILYWVLRRPTNSEVQRQIDAERELRRGV